MLRPPLKRWTRAQTADRVAQAPDMVFDRIDGPDLDELCRAYTAITGDPVRTPGKRQLVAACHRIHGPDTIAVIGQILRETGTVTNLLGLVRIAPPRPAAAERPAPPALDRQASRPGPMVRLPAPPPLPRVVPATIDIATWDGCRCPLDRLLPDLIYCDAHRPVSGATGTARHDRRSSNPRAARFFAVDSVADVPTKAVR